MIEHVTIHVEDLDEATAYYEALLAPLGYEVTRRLPDHDDAPRIAFGRHRRAQLWLVEAGMAHEGLVIALSADDAAAVAAFRAAAEAAGADEVSDAEERDGRTSAWALDANGNRLVAVAGGSGRGMIDHVQLVVSDFGRTLRFYEKLLDPLDVVQTARDLDGDSPRVGFGQGGETGLWLIEEGDPQSAVAIGFAAADRRQVDAFHSEAVDFGARNIAAAAVRKEVGRDYYVAGATDPDNNRIEAVHDGEHGLAPAAPVRASGDRLADAAALQRWEADRGQAKAAEMAEAEKRSGRNLSSLSTAPLAMAAARKKAEEEDLPAESADGPDDDVLASLGLGDGESSGSSDPDEIDWAALGLDSDGSGETETSSGDGEEIDWAALGLDANASDEASASGADEPFDFASLGLDDDSASEQPSDEPAKAAKPAKKGPISKSAMGLDF